MAQVQGADVVEGRKGGTGLIWVGLVLILLGVALAAFSGFRAITGSGLVDTITAPTVGAPATVTQTLTPGKYVVYEKSGFTTGVRSSVMPSMSPSEVTVTGPDGPVTVEAPAMAETVTRGSYSYVGVAAFKVDKAGDYRIELSPAAPTEVIIGPGLGSAFAKAAGWLLGVGFGGLLGVVGLVLLIVGVVKKSRRPKLASGTGSPMTGPGFGAGPGVGAIAPTPQAPQAPPGPLAQAPATAPKDAASTAAPPVTTGSVSPAESAAAPPVAPTGLPPAGWYPDPSGTGGQRYWDGSNWTQHLA